MRADEAYQAELEHQEYEELLKADAKAYDLWNEHVIESGNKLKGVNDGNIRSTQKTVSC